MDTGDRVLTPIGEVWVVAYVNGEHLTCCGWPESQVRVDQCRLVEAATPAYRLSLLQQMAAMSGSDSRKTYALHRLKEAETILPKEY